MLHPLNLQSALRLLLVSLGVLAGSTARLPAQQASVGINLAGDWLWADAVRQARPRWDTAAHLGDGAATEDGNGWPTQDCSLLVWEGHAYITQRLQTLYKDPLFRIRPKRQRFTPEFKPAR